MDIETSGEDPEKIPAENPREREGIAEADEKCGNSEGEYRPSAKFTIEDSRS